MTATAYPPHRIEAALEWAESCMSGFDYIVAAADGDRIEITHNQVMLAKYAWGVESTFIEGCLPGDPLPPVPDALVGFVDTVEAMRWSPRSAAE